MIILDFIWPALLVTFSMIHMWYLILSSFVVEWLAVHYLLKFPWKRSLKISVVGNLASSIFGLVVLPIPMLMLDGILNVSTKGLFIFSKPDWILTFAIMCFVSTFIEIKFVSRVFKIPAQQLRNPLIVGNFLSYAVMGILMELEIVQTI